MGTFLLRAFSVHSHVVVTVCVRVRVRVCLTLGVCVCAASNRSPDDTLVQLHGEWAHRLVCQA